MSIYAARGDTYPVKDQLRAAGGKWNKDKRQWEFSSAPDRQFPNVIFLPQPLPEGFRVTEGYRDGLEPGRVVKLPLCRGDKPEEFAVVVGQWPDKEFSSDSESWVDCTCTLIRPLTASEAEKLLTDRTAAKGRQAAIQKLRRPWSWEPKWERPEGCSFGEVEAGREKREFESASIPSGGGWWVFLSAGDVWVVLNNGHDGDDWSANNCRTWGAGAVAFRTTDRAAIAQVRELLALIGA